MIIYCFLVLLNVCVSSLSSEISMFVSNFENKGKYLSKFINSSSIIWFNNTNEHFHKLNLENFRSISQNGSIIEVSENDENYTDTGNFEIMSIMKNNQKEEFSLKNQENEINNHGLSCYFNKAKLSFNMIKDHSGLSNLTLSKSFKNAIFSFKTGQNGIFVFLNFNSEFIQLNLSNHSDYNFSALEVLNLFIKDDFILIQSIQGKLFLFQIIINLNNLRVQTRDLFNLIFINSFTFDEFILDVLINFVKYKDKIFLFNKKGMKIVDLQKNNIIYQQSVLDNNPLVLLNVNDVIIINDTLYLIIKGFGLLLADLRPLSEKNELKWLNNSFIHSNLISFDYSENAVNKVNTIGLQVYQDQNIGEFFIELILLNESNYQIYKVYTMEKQLDIDNFITFENYSYFFDKKSKLFISFQRGTNLNKQKEFMITELPKSLEIDTTIYSPLIKIIDFISYRTKIILNIFDSNYILINGITHNNPSFSCNFQKYQNYSITLSGISEICLENGNEMKPCLIEIKISLYTLFSKDNGILDIQNILGLILILSVILIIYGFVLIIRKKINERKQLYDTITKQDETELENK